MRVVTIDSPRREDAFCESIFAGAADVIHDLVFPILADGFADATGEGVECFIPGGAFPFTFAAFAGAFERVKDAIGIGDLVQSGGTLGAVASARTGVFRITFKLLDLAGDFVDIGQQPARRLAVEARCGHERIVPLDSSRPRARIELGPIVPPLLRRKGRQMPAARALVERLVFS